MSLRYALLLPALLLTACGSSDQPPLTNSVPVIEREKIATDGTFDQDAAVRQQSESFGTVDVYGEALGSEARSEAVQKAQTYLAKTIGDTVQFGYDSYDLTDSARQLLLGQAKWLQRYPNLQVTIEGHCDERGTREYNLALGERRASSVKTYLVALGVDPTRINVISFGKERPVSGGSAESAWSKNRRATTVVD